jgi:ABC-type antimicrobial peptide transport system permease subunit
MLHDIRDAVRSFARTPGFSIVAVVNALLATVGVYGPMSYSVAQRPAEMGVRLALGARPGQLARLVLAQGLSLALVGILVGIALAAAATRAIAGMLFDTSATDPTIYTGLSALVLTIAALACYVPARRAMRVDPITALRTD